MYVIICSTKTQGKWPKVLDILKRKYQAKWPSGVRTVLYKNELQDVVEETRKLRPSYCCFVVHYSECTKTFVKDVHSFTKNIDPSNPYTDTLWGIMTGQSEDDVIYAIQQEALVIRRVLTSCPVRLENFQSGLNFSEMEPGVALRKRCADTEVCQESCPLDATAAIVEEISTRRNIELEEGVDMVITSGHATEQDWNIGYGFKSGKLVPLEGKLHGRTVNGDLLSVEPNGKPKIYSAAGNCLMGHITGKNCMALAWMHSIGIVQMTGYLEPTWFGYAGWGVHKYFINNPGNMTFAEAFFANQQSLLSNLQADASNRGLIFDQDCLAFYGDPAYSATLYRNPSLDDFTINLTRLDPEAESPDWSVWVIKVVTHRPGQFDCPCADDKATSYGRPPVYVFPCTMKAVKLIQGPAILNCRFISLPLTGKYETGQEYKATFSVQNWEK